MSSPWIRTPEFPCFSIEDYNDYWEHRGWEVNSRLKRREELMLERIPEGARVLDVGCGNSRLPVALKEKGVNISIADVSSKVLEGYESFGITGKIIDLEQIRHAELGSEKYDFIIMSEVLEHIKNSEEVIAYLKPLTKTFLLTVPNSASYQFRYGLLFKGRFFTQWVYHPSEHVRFWSHIDFMDWLSAQGLVVKKVDVTDGFDFRGRWKKFPYFWKNLFGFRMLYECSVEDKDLM